MRASLPAPPRSRPEKMILNSAMERISVKSVELLLKQVLWHVVVESAALKSTLFAAVAHEQVDAVRSEGAENNEQDDHRRTLPQQGHLGRTRRTLEHRRWASLRISSAGPQTHSVGTLTHGCPGLVKS